jgi:SOS response regulatory protein OraA/RecX
MRRAVRRLARRPFGRAELEALLAKEAAPEDVARVLRRLEELKLLDDGDYAYTFAFRRITQEGWGPDRVFQELQRRRVPQHIVELAVARVRAEVSDHDALASYLDRRCRKSGWPRERGGILRLVNHLRRRGFADEAIFGHLRNRLSSSAWKSFETGEQSA